MEKINFLDWIDITNTDHLAAVHELFRGTGSFPPGFLPENVVQESYWLPGLLQRLALAYVELAQITKEREQAAWREGYAAASSS